MVGARVAREIRNELTALLAAHFTRREQVQQAGECCAGSRTSTPGPGDYPVGSGCSGCFWSRCVDWPAAGCRSTRTLARRLRRSLIVGASPVEPGKIWATSHSGYQPDGRWAGIRSLLVFTGKPVENAHWWSAMLGGLPVYGDLWPSGPDLELWNEIFLG